MIKFDINTERIVFPLSEDLKRRLELIRTGPIPLMEIKGDRLWTVGFMPGKVVDCPKDIDDAMPAKIAEHMLICVFQEKDQLNMLNFAWPVDPKYKKMFESDRSKVEDIFYENIFPYTLGVQEGCYIYSDDAPVN